MHSLPIPPLVIKRKNIREKGWISRWVLKHVRRVKKMHENITGGFTSKLIEVCREQSAGAACSSLQLKPLLVLLLYWGHPRACN